MKTVLVTLGLLILNIIVLLANIAWGILKLALRILDSLNSGESRESSDSSKEYVPGELSAKFNADLLARRKESAIRNYGCPPSRQYTQGEINRIRDGHAVLNPKTGKLEYPYGVA